MVNSPLKIFVYFWQSHLQNGHKNAVKFENIPIENYKSELIDNWIKKKRKKIYFGANWILELSPRTDR